jgi:hypothetical protein
MWFFRSVSLPASVAGSTRYLHTEQNDVNRFVKSWFALRNYYFMYTKQQSGSMPAVTRGSTRGSTRDSKHASKIAARQPNEAAAEAIA